MRFISKKYRELRLVLKPMSRMQVGLVSQIVPGVTVEFHNRMYETQNEEIIAALKVHPLYGTQFFSAQGADVPSIEGVRREEEKAQIAEEIASQCPKCGKQFKTAQQLSFHAKSHE